MEAIVVAMILACVAATIFKYAKNRYAKVPAIFVILILISAGAAAGALLEKYATVRETATVEQSVVFEDGTTEKDYDLGIFAGGDFACQTFSLVNRSVDSGASVHFDTIQDDRTTGAVEGNVAGIRTSYYRLTDYAETVETEEPEMSIPAVITVEDLGCAVRWTVDMDETDENFGNGHAAVGLVIGVGDNIRYQIHSNDGTCPAYPWGTWLYSEYDPGDGWHTSENAWNTRVTEVNGISASGDRYLAGGEYDNYMPWGPVLHEGNPELTFTVTIAKKLLIGPRFYWAMALIGDTPDTVTPADFSWGDTTTGNFHLAITGTPILDGFTIGAGERVELMVANDFDVALTPSDYRITTEIIPS